MFIGRRHYLRIGLIGIAVAQASSTDALPPPVEQYSANCAALSYASDQLVCSDPNLLDLDRKMVAALADARTVAIEPVSPFIEPQAAWLRRRSLCAGQTGHRACLEAAYAERTAVLTSLSGSTDQYGIPYICQGAALPKAAQIIARNDGIVLAFAAKQLVAVALSASAPEHWTPFLSVTGRGKNLTIRSINGAAAKCRKAKGLGDRLPH